MNMNTLLAGGVMAAVAGGWQQLKAAFNYLSSFIIVRAQFDSTTTMVMREYFRTEWTLMPSGLHVYKSRYFTFKGESHSNVVPFKLTAHGGIYRKGWRILFIHDSDSSMSVSYLRGQVDLDQIIRSTIQAFNERFADAHKTEGNNRYRIARVMGRERGVYPEGGGGASITQRAGASSLETSPDSDATAYLNPAFDPPLMYDKSQWTYSVKEDPFQALYFPPQVLKHVKQLQHWLSQGQWYSDRMIPWRRGVLLYGPGGTGKTSLAKAIAQELGVPVYQYFLSTLSDQEFVNAWDDMATPCVALLEDFDNVFHGRRNVTEHKLLTFDCVLNQISGINSHNGVLLIVTTNHIEKLDPAMGVSLGNDAKRDGVSTRPGRIDTVIEVSYLDRGGRQFLANRILRDWPEAISEMVEVDYPVTPAQFQEMCVQEAHKLMTVKEEYV